MQNLNHGNMHLDFKREDFNDLERRFYNMWKKQKEIEYKGTQVSVKHHTKNAWAQREVEDTLIRLSHTKSFITNNKYY